MASKYSDFSLNSGEYIPQYAGSPLEDITKTSEALQERHYSNLANLSSLQLLRDQYESKVTPGAKGYIRDQFQDIDNTLQEIAKNGGENSTAKIAALRNRFLGDQGVLGALKLAEGVQKEVDTENQLISQGKTPIRKKGVREKALNAPVIDPETGKLSDLYTKPYQSTVSPYENPVPYMKDIWSEIPSDSVEGDLKGIDSNLMKSLLGSAASEDGPDIPLFLESLTKAGIKGDKIKANLENAFDSYKETPAYKQAIEYSDNPSRESARQKKIFLEHGMLRVFNNISRQYMANPIADDLLRAKGKSKSGGTEFNPDLSIVTPKPKTPLDNIDNITETGDVKKPLLDKTLEVAWKNTMGGTPINKTYMNAIAVELQHAKEAGNQSETDRLQKEYQRVVSEREALDKPDANLTKEMIPYYKAAALYSNAPEAPDMSEDQLKAWAGTKEGKATLQAYKDNVLTEKYKSPIIQNIDEEKARDYHNLFLNSSLTQRKLIPYNDPNTIIHMSDLLKGDGSKEALNVSKWYTNDPSKIRFVGETTPQNWLGEGTDNEGEFTNAKIIEIPEGDGKSGKINRYYVSNLPSETNLIDVSEKALANTAKRIPGVPNKTLAGIEVYETINDNAKKALFKELGVPQIMQWPSTVTVRFGEDIIVAPNYKTAAFELAKRGKYLTSSK